MNEILPFAPTWMGLTGIMLYEISQTEKDKYCMTSHVWNESTYLPNSQIQRTDWWLQEVELGGGDDG